MLTFLSIRDVVLIERLDLPFEKGLSVLTGETGAGKSILLDSLSLVLGGRADSTLIRRGAAKLSVCAEFSLAADHPVYALLADADWQVEPAEPLLLRREVSTDGRSRAYVNDRPASVGLLKRLGGELVEIHGQFESHSMLDPARHGPVLDGFTPETTAALNRVRAAYTAWDAAAAARRDAERMVEKARQEEDYLRACLAELEALAPKAGEEAVLAEERALMMNGEKLGEAVNEAMSALAEPADVARSLHQVQRALARIAATAPEAVVPILEGFERAAVELSEARNALEAFAAQVDLDPDRLEQVEERLFSLRALARKHDCPVDDLPALLETTAAALRSLDDGDDRFEDLLKAETRARETYIEAATALSKARRKAALALDAAVNAELPPLKLEKATFETALEPLSEDQWGPRGADRVVFQVATNPGAAPAPLHKIASGGELARFMLALKVVLAADGDIATLVFDEVDAGIGGATAAAVGDRLARLGRTVQVLVVTHSPQVAARGNRHYQVSKQARGGDLPGTDVRELSNEDRLEEVARMLAGTEISREARAAAKVLLERVA